MVGVNIYFLAAVAAVITVVYELVRHWKNNRKESVQDIVHHALTPIHNTLNEIKTDLAVIRTKVDPMWTGWNANIAHNAAVLHHPEPSRARVDYLLDVLRGGTITSEEVMELRGHLTTIMHWEPGLPAPYKIFQGEQAAAAALLSSLDVVPVEETNGLSDSSASGAEEEGTGLPG